MISQTLLEELQQLSREEKLEVIRLLSEEASHEFVECFEGGHTAMLPLVRAPQSAISVIEQLEREAQTDG